MSEHVDAYGRQVVDSIRMNPNYDIFQKLVNSLQNKVTTAVTIASMIDWAEAAEKTPEQAADIIVSTAIDTMIQFGISF